MKMFTVFVLAFCASCFASDTFKGPCYQVRGRLSYYNGTPSNRIWIVGTHRMLGVSTEDQQLPATVKGLLKSFDDQIFADYTVCPLLKERRGEMRMVFVKSATHVVNRPQPY